MHAITSMRCILEWMYRYIMRGTEGGQDSHDACMHAERSALLSSIVSWPSSALYRLSSEVAGSHGISTIFYDTHLVEERPPSFTAFYSDSQTTPRGWPLVCRVRVHHFLIVGYIT